MQHTIQLFNLSLVSIDSGDLEFMAKVARELNVTGINYEDLEKKESLEWKKIENMYRTMRMREAERHNEQAIIGQWAESVEGALAVVTSRVIEKLTKEGARVEKTLRGDIRKRINTRKKQLCGAISKDTEICKKHYQFLKNLEVELIEKGVPAWLQ
jgi:hypothetical protein